MYYEKKNKISFYLLLYYFLFFLLTIIYFKNIYGENIDTPPYVTGPKLEFKTQTHLNANEDEEFFENNEISEYEIQKRNKGLYREEGPILPKRYKNTTISKNINSNQKLFKLEKSSTQSNKKKSFIKSFHSKKYDFEKEENEKHKKTILNIQKDKSYLESEEKYIHKTYTPQTPNYYQGLYLNNQTIHSEKKFRSLLSETQELDLNVFVIDLQPKLPAKKLVEEMKGKGFHLVGRVVVFQGGLKVYPPSSAQLEKIYALIKNAVELGFSEIQLDYIRFADTTPLYSKNNSFDESKNFEEFTEASKESIFENNDPPQKKYSTISLKQRYDTISDILKKTKKLLSKYKVALGVDVFGRITFNKDDMIGQRLENISETVDIIYPMLYPSHFYGMPEKIRNPYQTILKGIQESKKRIRPQVKLVAFIQAFKMSIAPTNLSYINYISEQIKAAKNSGGDGFIAWNPNNHYEDFFKAIRESKKK